MSKQDILLESGTNELEIIEFFISSGTDTKETMYFGVNVAKVLEVIESPNLRPPKSPPHPSYMGTMPLRERILPLLDLSKCLGLDRHHEDYEVILVTEFNQRVTGFLVSGVTRIHRANWSDVKPPSKILAQLPENCINGMINLDDHFTLLLDLERILSDLDPEMMSEAQRSTHRSEESYTALVADDSGVMRMMVTQKLEGANFNTIVATNGKEAWEMLQRMSSGENQMVDIVVSDIEMPGMDGYTLARHIKEDRSLKQMPVMLFSSLITEDQMHKGHSVGADEQISKPEFEQLALRAIRLVETARANAAKG